MSQGKEKPGKPAKKPEGKTKMKNTKTVKELTTKRQKKEIKSIISDYEANALIAANLIKVIETGDFSAWRQNWHFATTTTDLYYEVVDGFACAYALAAMPITIENSFAGHDDCPLPAGFYLNFKEIKSNNLKLKKGAIGQPLYERKSFYKQLTKLEEETLLKEEDLALEWEILQEDHRHQFKAVFTVTKEDGTTYDFDEIILWDYHKNQPGYQRHQYVLVYYYNNNDLVNPIDIKALWKVGERPIRSAAEKILVAILLFANPRRNIAAEAVHVAVDRHGAVGMLYVDGIAVTCRRNRHTANVARFDGVQGVAAAGVGAPVQTGVEMVAAQLAVCA